VFWWHSFWGRCVELCAHCVGKFLLGDFVYIDMYDI